MNQVVIHDAQHKQWLRFSHPVKIITTHDIGSVLAKLKEVNNLVQEQQLWAAGFLSYESATAFDEVLLTNENKEFPLLWFGLYQQPEIIDLPSAEATELELNWQPTITKAEYDAAIAKIKQYISAGDTYQVNYTTRLRSAFNWDPWQYWLRLLEAQQADYGAYLDLADFTICSASPELFFTLEDNLEGKEITARPMKGTSARGYNLRSDRAAANWLQNSAKNQAENVMIVDMIRNDLARVAKLSTVQVSSLFEVEKYPTLWQMTSTVKAKTEATFPQIMEALFPCASITGAPKPSTMEIIKELEPTPRKIYTGSIGYLSPQNRAQFNVAIRTVLIDKQAQEAEYGVGGGIVWDSASASEYEECQIKARVLLSKAEKFDLLETMLWTPGEDYFLLDYHLRRLTDSAAYFNYPLNLELIEKQLTELANTLSHRPYKIRLLISQQGKITLESYPIELNQPAKTIRLAIADSPVDITNPFLYHKTTNRKVYQQAKEAHPQTDDVILWNERQEVTETCIYNLVIKKAGKLLTPPIESGLLGGTFRAYLLEQQKIQEAVITLDELQNCEAIYVINSVRKWQNAILS